MDAVDEAEPVAGEVGETRSGSWVGVKEPKAPQGGEAVVDTPIRCPDGVGEGGEEAGEGEQEEENGGEEARTDGVAGAVVGEEGDEHLECEEGAGGKQVRQVGCAR